jgi:diguanylate cyclase (GGDEF)-like protein/PAS domain S-box-containing protein
VATADDVTTAGLSDQELLRATFTASPLALAVVSADGMVLLWNPAAERMFGWSAAEVMGRPLPILEHLNGWPYRDLLDEAIAGHEVLHRETVRRHRNGSLLDVSLSAVVLRDSNGRARAILGTYKDISDRKRASAELVRQAREDDLTGLANRRGLLEKLRVSQAGRRRRITVVSLDLDHFKNVNDAFGRGVGDQVLSAFARRLAICVRPSDVVARLEGATFAVVMLGISPSAVRPVVARMFAAVTQRYTVVGHPTLLTVTGGVASCCSRLEQPTELVRRSELALHHAKRVSRGSFEVLDEALDRALLDRIQLSSRLLDAAARGELRLQYQPIIAAESRAMVGVEALVRWEHPERGLLSPNEFIPLAEESGSISSIGRWVLQEACATLRQWTDAEPLAAALIISVNISAAQLHDGKLIKDVKDALKCSGIRPDRLHLEVTESVLSADPEAAARALSQLRALGVWLVLDDFGTGNSSLTALQRCPFRVLKIDRSFVGGIGLRTDDETIVAATLALAHGLGLAVVAEGVETAEQAEFLTRRGCEELQGFLFGRPRPAAMIAPLLALQFQPEHPISSDCWQLPPPVPARPRRQPEAGSSPSGAAPK